MAATFVVCFANWNSFVLKIYSADIDASFFILGTAFVIAMSLGAFAMLMPAALGVVISEVFAIRSILFHATNGAIASWIGWAAMQQFLKKYEFYSEPTIVVSAGIAAGLAYWAIAGWSAGFWRPVFSRPSPA